jgi:hypothetical protein
MPQNPLTIADWEIVRRGLRELDSDRLFDTDDEIALCRVRLMVQDRMLEIKAKRPAPVETESAVGRWVQE